MAEGELPMSVHYYSMKPTFHNVWSKEAEFFDSTRDLWRTKLGECAPRFRRSVKEHGNDSETRAAHRCPACSHLKLPGPWEWYEGPRGPDYNSKGHPLPASWPV
jgi:hypothetical protein